MIIKYTKSSIDNRSWPLTATETETHILIQPKSSSFGVKFLDQGSSEFEADHIDGPWWVKEIRDFLKTECKWQLGFVLHCNTGILLGQMTSFLNQTQNCHKLNCIEISTALIALCSVACAKTVTHAIGSFSVLLLLTCIAKFHLSKTQNKKCFNTTPQHSSCIERNQPNVFRCREPSLQCIFRINLQGTTLRSHYFRKIVLEKVTFF